jgi:FkbM family methyltransferase
MSKKREHSDFNYELDGNIQVTPFLCEIPVTTASSIHVPRELKSSYTNFETLSVEYISSRIKEGFTCVDVGANFGFYTTLLSQWVGPKGHVSAFEPDPNTLPILERNIKNLLNVNVIPRAVSNRTELVNFFHTTDFVNSSTNKNIPFKEKSEIIPIPNIEATTLDEYFDNNEEVNFIKIDIQGDDIKALIGARNLIKRSSDITLLVEWAPYWMLSAGYNILDLPNTLNDLGFKSLTVIDDYNKKISTPYEFVSEVKRTNNIRRFCNLFAEVKM